ncbi:Pex12 amino terminal region-domain-containing protein [Syncephalastrum racemosum]|uniref:RING-type E3 ubiquitin transferase (cysteine targeting) n=1 Tax=Syncephalastrum racemosum TaxID=13706 RepID=A0A1X2H0X7_SYNRA|nr:Pex12 amino terminal region-domain-containing protein [Syncephalastrum racemosum]
MMPRAPSQVPEHEWATQWKELQPMLRKVRRSMATVRALPLRVMRVSQLDSDILDMELFDILKEQLWSSLSLFQPTIRERFEPELLALLNFVLFKFSVYDSGATYGAQLQNLKYRNEWMHSRALESIAKDAPLSKTQKILYGLFTVGGQYAWIRANRYITEQGWGELDESEIRNKVYRTLQAGEKYWKAFTLINFLVFLANGRFRTLIDRVLGMRLVYAQKSQNRQVSFEFLNRQMVWHAFTEFLLFLVPLINVEKLKLRLTRMLLPKSYLVSSKGYDQLPQNQCAVCHDAASAETDQMQVLDFTVHNPYQTNCGHIYCYYCIQSKLSVFGDEWPCLRCGERVVSITKRLEKADKDADEDAKAKVEVDDKGNHGEEVEEEKKEKDKDNKASSSS